MTDNQLAKDIELAQAGDADAWARLLKTYRPVMERWAAQFFDNEASRNDLVQLAWMKVFRGLKSFEGSEDAEIVPAVFFAWLKTVVYRTMINELQSRDREIRKADRPIIQGQEGSLTDERQHTPSTIAINNEQLRKLRKAVKGLGNLDRQIIEMLTHDGLEPRMVAQLLGLEYSAVQRRFKKLLKKLSYRI